jgi:methylenetetrahydrofolate reductase (NADH)
MWQMFGLPAKAPQLLLSYFLPGLQRLLRNLIKTIDELVALKPDFVSVTFGADGSTREGSCQLIEKMVYYNL